MVKVRLEDICTINPKAISLKDTDEVSFVPMPKVGEHGEFDPSEVKLYQDVKKGFTAFQDGDVLFAKITPCMENGKGAIAEGLKNGIGYGSTEFHVLRADKKHVTNAWLYYLTSWPEFRRVATLNMTGSAGQKRVPKSFLAKYTLSLPTLSEQRRMTDCLDKINALISLRRQQLEKLDTLVKSQFIEMFGDPIFNPKNYPEIELRNLGDLARGVSKSRPRNKPELLGGPYPLVQTGEVSSAELYIKSYTSTYSEEGLAQSKMWPKGTLCITIAANIAQTGILTFDACFPDSVVGFISGDKVNQIYIHFWFSFFQKILEEQAPQVAQKNINLKILGDLKVMVPPVTLQQQFTEFVQQADKSKFTIQQSLDRLEILKKALMQEYFG